MVSKYVLEGRRYIYETESYQEAVAEMMSREDHLTPDEFRRLLEKFRDELQRIGVHLDLRFEVYRP